MLLPIRHRFSSMLLRVCALALAFLLVSCKPEVRDRPYGELRLGRIQELLGSQIFLDKAGLLLRRDEQGWYAMSTLCTHDLSVLRRRNGPNGLFLASVFSTSTYDLNGRVLSGPAIKDLPYYELYVEQGVADGPRDTLYARIGNEKPRDWRLPIPLPLGNSETAATVPVP